MRRSLSRSTRVSGNWRALPRERKRLAVAIGVTIVLCSMGLGLAARRKDRSGGLGGLRAIARPSLATATPGRPLNHMRLAVQPLADRLRRRLGQRFDLPGHEVTTMTGVLSIGGSHHQVTIVRIQDDGGERAMIALDNGPATLVWDGTDGAVSGDGPAAGNDRSLIERLALDSPDQFIMAQLRGASYQTIASSARPEGALNDSNYTGPIWDVVRVAEPDRGNPHFPLSTFRIYHINVVTGLLDKILSVEAGQTIEADILGWANQGGDVLPTHITWNQGSQTLMELTLTGVNLAPIQ